MNGFHAIVMLLLEYDSVMKNIHFFFRSRKPRIRALALILPINGGHSVGKVHLRIKGHALSLSSLMSLLRLNLSVTCKIVI